MTILRGHGSVEKGKLAAAIPVGASLLAMAACQSASMSNVQSLSRASSLPQEFTKTALSFRVRTSGIHQIFQQE
ncbi:hypothetical protein AO356_17595 [Pseudomonas fluorescens]|uniref:Lipoprotein n=1 Tax=Pseudomonas fluorescens TaxID=294 RepID=A0A0N9WA86_PSEFL|nr:hypothetical protein AO356_17595 [Pseudomonas fluorescens]POA15163.1 hypothetical protein C1892_07605 [Pseudomonas sp. MPBD7-1]